MKKLVLIFIVTIFAGSTLFAQGRQLRSPEDIAKIQTKNLVEKLELTKAQEDSVYQIYLKSAETMRAQRGNKDGGDREQRRAAFQKAQEQVNKDIKTVLTDDQKKKYDQLAKEMQSRRPAGNREGRQQRN